MQTFNVTFSRNYVVVLILVLIPLSVVAVFLSLLLSTKDLPDWAVLLSSVVMMGVSLGAVLLTLKHWGTVPAIVNMDAEGLSIRLKHWSPFYPRRDYSSHWDGLSNVSTNYDPQHNKRFYLISFKHSATVSIDPGDVASEDSETPFGNVLLGFVEQYNSTHTSKPETLIRRRGFYDTWWAKGLTGCCYLFIAIAIIGYFVDGDTFPLWRLIQVISFSSLWIAAYYANKRHSKA